MQFRIKIRTGYKDLSFPVERINVTERSEQFKIYARNKTITLESNRPLFRNKGLKHRKPDWKLVEGDMIYSRDGLEKLSEAIMLILEPPAPVKKKPPLYPSSNPVKENRKKKGDGPTLEERVKK